MADILEMKMPSPGESITEVEVAQLLVENGAVVDVDDPIAEIDSDKATLELNAEAAGKIEFLVEEGDTVEVGQVVCKIDTSVKPEPKAESKEPSPEPEAEKPKTEPQAAAQAKPAAVDAKATPVAKAMIQDSGADASRIKGSGSGGKILKSDVEAYLAGGFNTASELSGWGGTRDESREKMSSLRRKISTRLVSVKNETAMLTTFNEVDMSFVMDLRKKYKEAFKEKHGVSLGFMSFLPRPLPKHLGCIRQ